MNAFRLPAQAQGRTRLVPITFSTLNADAYDAGDVLAATQELADALPNGSGVLCSVRIVDGDDQAAADMNVYILKANVALGTEDSAISISDANAAEIIGVVKIAQADWVDLINSKMAYKECTMPVVAATGTTSLYVALTTAGTPTQTATGITGLFGILSD